MLEILQVAALNEDHSGLAKTSLGDNKGISLDDNKRIDPKVNHVDTIFTLVAILISNLSC